MRRRRAATSAAEQVHAELVHIDKVDSLSKQRETKRQVTVATFLVALMILALNRMSSHLLSGIAKLQVHTLSPSHAIRCFTAYATMRKARIVQLGHAFAPTLAFSPQLANSSSTAAAAVSFLKEKTTFALRYPKFA